MTNTEISENNSEKELTINKSISDDKTQQISKKNTAQNKKIGPKNNKSTKSFDEISNEIFRDLVLKKDSLIKDIKELETKKRGASNNISIISVTNHSNSFKFYAFVFEYWFFANNCFCFF